MRKLCATALLVCAATAAGCGARPRPEQRVPRAPATQPVAATQPLAPTTVPSIATLTLDEILPAAELPRLPATAPTTRPAGRPPIDALLLYGRAVDDLNAGRRSSAIESLEKAVALDPVSFELHYALGRAYARDGSAPDARALAELQRAAEINPDHLRLQVDLGRALLAAGEEDKGLWHLRLALKTAQYATDEAGGAAAELLLGRALAREGYHTAAVEAYERLLTRLENPGPALRANPETAFLIARPELLRLQVAESYAQVGRFEPALQAYRAASRRDPGSFELRARVVKALVGLKRYDEAAAEAADAVARFRASPASVALLRETTAGGVVEHLLRLRRQRPRERSLLFATADVLRIEGRADEARRLLRDAAGESPTEPELVRRLYEAERDADPQGLVAARFLVDWSARHLDAVHLLGDHWDDLLRRDGQSRYGLRTLQKLEPVEEAGPRWAAAKEFWVAHVARLRHRRDVARAALHAAAQTPPPYGPALRALAGWDTQDLGMSSEQRRAEVERLAAAAERDDAAMGEELRGMVLLSARDFAGARQRLARAVELSPSSPERRFALAVAARGAGDEAAFERAMWKLVSDYTGFEDAYDALYAYYEGRANAGAASQVLSAWLAADPSGVPARLIQVREQVREGRLTAAQGLLQRLYADRPGDVRVLSALRAVYGQAGSRTRTWLVSELRQRHGTSPGEVATAAQLADLLADDGRSAEATRVLDDTRAAVADDPDLLYQLAALYSRVGQKAVTEQVLRDALKLDPRHAPAANDLGYSLAEEGRDLGRAEELARLAVEAEPANASFLDSLGWVLYKRGRFDEARLQLGRAAAQNDDPEGDGPDPVVLDHLGDTLYRLGDKAAAGTSWERAAKRLADMPAEQRDRDDLKQLRLQLERKRKQLEADQPVVASPVVESAGPATRPRETRARPTTNP